MSNEKKNNKSDLLTAVILGGGLLYFLSNKKNNVMTLTQPQLTLLNKIEQERREKEIAESWISDQNYFSSLPKNGTDNVTFSQNIIPRIIPNTFSIRETRFDLSYYDDAKEDVAWKNGYMYTVCCCLEIYLPETNRIEVSIERFSVENIRFGGTYLFQVYGVDWNIIKRDQLITAQRDKLFNENRSKFCLHAGLNFIDCLFYFPYFPVYKKSFEKYLKQGIYLVREDLEKVNSATSFSFDLLLDTGITEQKRWKLTIKEPTTTNKTQFDFDNGVVTTFQKKEYFSFNAPSVLSRPEWREYYDTHEGELTVMDGAEGINIEL